MSHQAGPMLDAELATRFRRWGDFGMPHGYRRPPMVEQEIPPFSTDIAAAWRLVEMLQMMQFDVAIMTTAKDRAQLGAWTCAVSNGEIGIKSSAATAALAISRAMLAILTEFERNSGS